VKKHSTKDKPLKFEYKFEPLATRAEFLWREATFVLMAIGILALALGIGVCGYRIFEGLTWVDSLLNASMILGGMGQVDPIKTTGGKLFASFYALFSGLIFVVSFGVILSPMVHRTLHRFHLDEHDQKDQ
jgi:flagellar biosynthesis protein FliR